MTEERNPGEGVPEVEALRQAVAEREARIKALEEEMGQGQLRQEAQGREMQERLKAAATRYRSLLLAGSPEVPEELVRGESVEEVEASFAQARQVVEKVRRGLEARLQKERVPAGAPPRTPPDLSALSPQEKIAQALARR